MKRQSSNVQVVCKCLQALTSLFSRRDLASVYARRLAPSVVALLRPYVLEKEAESAVKEVREEFHRAGFSCVSPISRVECFSHFF